MDISIPLINRILMVYLDPCRNLQEKDWHFVSGGTEDYRNIFRDRNKDENSIIIISFTRKNWINYLVFRVKLIFSRRNNKIRYVLYVNDGLLSSVFDAGNVSGYRFFAKKHLQEVDGILTKLIYLIPTIWRADVRFIILERHSGERGYYMPDMLKNNDFMMFSNAAGKLLLTRTETLATGKGEVVKTTANSDYVGVIKTEYRILTLISDRISSECCAPKVGNSLEINGLFFYSESYINGRSLRDILRDLATKNSSDQVCEIIERLDVWYNQLQRAFSGETLKLSTFYSPILKTFDKLYGENATGHRILQEVSETLLSIDKWHPGLVPVIAHNDLWPANFILDSDVLIAIDWERAKKGQAGVFDYFWMMISTAIVYFKDQNKLSDYGVSYRQFLAEKDIVSIYIKSKLRAFIRNIGFSYDWYDLFMLMFLMEWSVQGYSCLGQRTDMDRLALKELKHFYHAKYHSRSRSEK